MPKQQYEIMFNNIFTGSYLDHNLGHEIINFIKTDEHERYIYLNPWGARDEEKAQNIKYVFHIMQVTYKNNNYYELVAVSEVDQDTKSIYNPDPKKEPKEGINYKKHSLYEIFENNRNSIDPEQKEAHLYSFKATKLYKPNKYRIFFTFKNHNPQNNNDLPKNIIKIDINCNSGRQVTYLKDEKQNKELKELIKKYLVENDETINLENYDDDPCLAVISDRTNLEDSMSNQIAYFLNRNEETRKAFINLINQKITNEFKVKDSINEDEINNIQIIREENGIDLLLMSSKHVIVIENKIDSYINGIDGKNSQLSKYYHYVTDDIYKEKNKEKLKKMEKFKNKTKYFFILEPEYSSITNEILKEFNEGDKYKIITYNELHHVLINTNYYPYKNKDNEKRNFLYKQFLAAIEYVCSSKAEQKQKTAYIRLKQRIEELDNKK